MPLFLSYLAIYCIGLIALFQMGRWETRVEYMGLELKLTLKEFDVRCWEGGERWKRVWPAMAEILHAPRVGLLWLSSQHTVDHPCLHIYRFLRVWLHQYT